ncbi:glycosyltransferase [Serratia entomophila]|uniref:glycosyltransferase n=1 Tax=Serratia entomophila TaxID=42906 RepID=UPI0021779E35|nr:glycosyltransferase [Serratia entomophila]CAI1145365.1 D-inositol-3-phosphate glycosyltransferase [Serratia entomophila]CAI1150515.1 D-inositol-3-phosphate glycosyltransferase [Serratia entomophila]CAI1164932.1 D-inositol-3-phosphate glycosyltransferase [Serratia entomophila]CAI1987789.1 D-inositol-3-phosphate glycosyltransferase [Serratia entomophila]CAI1992248.1 D-inositol-3-phosphate glycosyltransferase [Serratia entomophila]
MRILMIIDGLPGGGAEKVVLTLCQGMQQMGHAVSLISLRDVCKYPIPAGIDYQIVADRSRAPWRKLTELSRRAAALDLTIAAHERQHGAFDLVFSNLHKTDRIVSRSKLLASDRLWFCIHGILSTSYLGHRKGLDRWLKQRKIAAVYQDRNIVAVSQAVGDDLQQNLPIRPHRLAVINNPFDIAAIQQLAAEPCELAGQDYLVHVGRFHPHKRHDRLLKAYAQSGIQAPLALIGAGSDTQMAETKRLAEELGIADRVRFLGFQANPYPFIRNASLLVLSSDSEGFGNVLVEALLCDTPVVSTRCPGGPAEIMEKAGMANALAELNESSLAEKMAEVYANPPEINHQQLLNYGLEPICRQYLALKK